ncbi:MAG TPA: GxxExxY protein [Chthoniobacterales bacterium]|jgi:hypothetical protein
MNLTPLHDAQLLSYLKLGGWNVGLIFNFNGHLLKHGIRRRVSKSHGGSDSLNLNSFALSASSPVKSDEL